VFFLQPKKPKLKPKTVVSRNFSKQNMEKFKNSLQNMRWGFVLEEEDPQVAYNLFSDTFFNLYNLQFLLKEVKFNINQHKVEPWMSKGLLTSRYNELDLASQAARNLSLYTLAQFKT